MNTNKAEWSTLLESAVKDPGKIHEAYTRFHGYSLGNRLSAMFQCMARNIQPGPIATYKKWQTLGRCVTKGQKAITLCRPVINKKKTKDESGKETESTYAFFVWKPFWFVLSQTEGKEYIAPETPEWNESKALSTLGIEKVEFAETNGNTQGCAMKGNKISVSPIAGLPYKTLFHEIAHVLLGHVNETSLTDSEETPKSIKEVEAESVAMLCSASLNLPGIEYSRGYIQHWMDSEGIPEKSAHRIFSTAEKILKAGTSEGVTEETAE